MEYFFAIIFYIIKPHPLLFMRYDIKNDKKNRPKLIDRLRYSLIVYKAPKLNKQVNASHQLLYFVKFIIMSKAKNFNTYHYI